MRLFYELVLFYGFKRGMVWDAWMILYRCEHHVRIQTFVTHALCVVARTFAYRRFVRNKFRLCSCWIAPPTWIHAHSCIRVHACENALHTSWHLQTLYKVVQNVEIACAWRVVAQQLCSSALRVGTHRPPIFWHDSCRGAWSICYPRSRRKLMNPCTRAVT